MDDIARDPHPEAQVKPSQAQARYKGPASEFAVHESIDDTLDGDDTRDETVEGAADTRDSAADDDFAVDPGARRSLDAGAGARDAVPRLPRVLPLMPAEDIDDDDDLLGAPAIESAPANAGARPDEIDPELDDSGDGDAGSPAAQASDAGAGEGGPPGVGPGEADPRGSADSEGDSPAEPITDPAKLVRVIYGLLLTNRDGLSALRLAQVCDTTQEAVHSALDSLKQGLAAQGAPLELTKSGEAFKLWTSPDVYPYLERLRGLKKNERLSPAALETLAVIAYRQPVFRAEIEAVRGVKAGPMLRTLLDCKLVKVVGRADVPGRPLQYGTTQHFLERFGLSSLSDLPSVKEFKGLSG